VYVNGVLLKENYAYIDPDTKNWPMRLEGHVLKNNEEVTVPEDCLFVMGDNRNESSDSRHELIGFINKKYIVGKVFFRFWPLVNLKFF